MSVWGKSCQADGRGREKLYMGICLKCLRNTKKARVAGLLEARTWMEETGVREMEGHGGMGLGGAPWCWDISRWGGSVRGVGRLDLRHGKIRNRLIVKGRRMSVFFLTISSPLKECLEIIGAPYISLGRDPQTAVCVPDSVPVCVPVPDFVKYPFVP